MADNQSNQDVELIEDQQSENVAVATDPDSDTATEDAGAAEAETAAEAGAAEAESEAESTAVESEDTTASAEAVAAEAVADEAAADEAAADEAVADEAVADEAVADEAVADEASADEASAEAEPEAEASADAETEPEGDPDLPPGVDSETIASAFSLPEEAEEPQELPTAGPVDNNKFFGYTGEIQGRVVTLAELEEMSKPVEVERPLELENLYDATITNVTEHDIVTGTIITIGEKDVVIDIGFKSDGIVARNEFDDEIETGQEVEVYLERLEDRQGQLVLSKRRADDLRRWQRIEDAFDNDKVVEGTIVNRIKGGMVVDLFGTEAFLPGSQIDIRPVRDFDAYLGKRMEFKVVKLNPVNGNVVVSHKALIEKDLQEQRDKILSMMEPGQILEGIVKNITDFGVFIDLGGVDGLLHITDLSWGRVSHPSEMVDLDEKMNVVVLDYDKERQRISLGLKQLQPHPWENINEKFVEGGVVEGKVVSITDYGAFVELEKGIEGLVHISEMSWTKHVRHPSEVVNLGDITQVKILRIDSEGRKISLGMKQLEPDPWETLPERHPPGTVTRGIVRNITNFGVFVELEPGIDGLVHISDLSWTKKIRHPSEVVKKGQEMDVTVLDIDVENRRLSLGHKQVETNPWNQFSVAYAEGTDTSAKVARFEESGIVVELPLEVEAFVPASHLLRDSHQESYEVGAVLDLRVIDFDAKNRKIVLSERRRVEAEERSKRDQEYTEKRQERQRERQQVDTFSRSPRSRPSSNRPRPAPRKPMRNPR